MIRTMWKSTSYINHTAPRFSQVELKDNRYELGLNCVTTNTKDKINDFNRVATLT